MSARSSSVALGVGAAVGTSLALAYYGYDQISNRLPKWRQQRELLEQVSQTPNSPCRHSTGARGRPFSRRWHLKHALCAIMYEYTWQRGASSACGPTTCMSWLDHVHAAAALDAMRARRILPAVPPNHAAKLRQDAGDGGRYAAAGEAPHTHCSMQHTWQRVHMRGCHTGCCPRFHRTAPLFSLCSVILLSRCSHWPH